MRSFGIIILISGLLLVGAVFALGVSFWNDPSPSGHGQAAGLFVFIVFGLPAVGFFIVTTVFGTLMAVSGAPAKTPERGQAVLRQVFTPPWHRVISIVGFWIAVLWTVPYGFLATVSLITNDVEHVLSSLLTWVLVAGPAFAAHIIFKPKR